MRIPDFVLSLDGMSVIRITDPSFELRQVTDEDVADLPTPQAVCEFNDGRKFAVVKWLVDVSRYKPRELELFASRAAEYLVDRWNEEAPAD